jgi:hypothetical protein
MQMMSARMAAEGASRETAREIYRRMYEESTDTQVRALIEARLLQIISFDERDVIRRVLNDYALRNGGRCAASWKDVSSVLVRIEGLRFDASGVPVDPMGAPYALVSGGCDVDLSEASKIPRR